MINNSQQYTILFILTLSNSFFALNNIFSNNISFNNDFFTSICNNIFLLTLVNKLTINSILQKTWLFSFSNVKFSFINLKTKHKRFFNRYFNFRIAKNLFIDSFTNLTVFFNCNSAVIKVCLAFFVKANFVNFYKSKIYKKVITNTQYKIN